MTDTRDSGGRIAGHEHDCPGNRRAELGMMFFWGGIWLFWMIQPFAEAVQHIDTPGGALGVVVAPAFCVAYLWHFYARRSVFFQIHAPRGVVPRSAGDYTRFVGLGVLAALCVVAVGQSGYTAAVFFALSAMWTFSTASGWVVVVGVAATYVGLWHLRDWEPDWGTFIGLGFGALAISVGRTAARRQRALQRSREVNAELMVQQERNRMARDLHDILGHSLTVITVKAELAGRLMDNDAPERARAEVADLERLSRTALADVRRAVEGYREMSLAGELARAREALTAAGIQARTPSALDQVPADLVEPFAWTVRECVTNVLRHSGADTCTITLAPGSITIADDGIGADPKLTMAGNGLVGLRERAAAAGAVLITRSVEPHGFSITLTAHTGDSHPEAEGVTAARDGDPETNAGRTEALA